MFETVSCRTHLVDGRGEHLGRDGRGHLLQLAAQPLLLQRAERLGLGGVVQRGGLVPARAPPGTQVRPGGALGFSRLAGATQ